MEISNKRGRSHDSLKGASALPVKVMEIQTSVAPSEIWLRDDLENIYALRSGSSGAASGWR